MMIEPTPRTGNDVETDLHAFVPTPPVMVLQMPPLALPTSMRFPSVGSIAIDRILPPMFCEGPIGVQFPLNKSIPFAPDIPLAPEKTSGLRIAFACSQPL